LPFEAPKIPIVANVTAEAETDPVRIKKLLLNQLTAPVRWWQTMQFLKNNKIDTLIEIGPGKVLTGLAKREITDASLVNIDRMEDIDKFAAIAAE
jgi:[acyl-carrier-protein] S-malonyltransferase